MAIATIVGGETVQLSLSPPSPQFDGDPLNQAARDALAALGKGFPGGVVIDDEAESPGPPGPLYVYNFAGDAGHPFTLPGGAQAVVLTGQHAAAITGHAGTELLIGNEGQDTIDAGGGSGTIIGGEGANEIIAGAGTHLIEVGKGKDTINLTGGSDTVVTLGGKNGTQGGNVEIHVAQTNLLVSGSADVVGSGNDTIAFGGGTVIEAGSATVSGSGSFKFDASSSSGNESVTAGSGATTMLGGVGTNVFLGGSGFASMIAGAGSHDIFAGGSGDTFMDASQAASVLFRFDSSHAGGFHTIANFTEGKDHLQLIGYDTASAFAGAHVQGHDTVISLDGGQTSIVLKGFTGLKATDFN